LPSHSIFVNPEQTSTRTGQSLPADFALSAELTMSGFRVMRADRQTDRQTNEQTTKQALYTHHSTSHPSLERSKKYAVISSLSFTPAAYLTTLCLNLRPVCF